MKFFSFLGSEDFFLLVLPLVYWCVDSSLGARVGIVLITSSYLNGIFKLLFAGPRPYWVSERVLALAEDASFGVPSGHAQNAVGIWGTVASRIRTRWAWGVAIALMFFIGFSRWYLGVHFPHDVIAGWLIGILLLWLFTKYWNPVAAWLNRKRMGSQILIGFTVSLLFIAVGSLSVGRLGDYDFPDAWEANALRPVDVTELASPADGVPDPASMEGSITSAGVLFGLAAGAAWINARGGYQADGPIEKRALRFVVGVIGVLVLWMGLGELFPDNSDLVSYVLRYVRYMLVGMWLFAGAPWLFFRFKLAKSNM
jgi:hypothetical protein